MKKILICGSRSWTSGKVIRDIVGLIKEDVTIIHGDCKTGADAIADHYANLRGLTVMAFPADWARLGRRAGPARNTRMLDENPDLVIAFTDDLERSRGTRDTVTKARKRGIPVEVINSLGRVDRG